MLATAHHETGGRLEPIIETTGPKDITAVSEAVAIGRLESAWANGRLSWVRRPYWRRDRAGKTWLGRGFVQLTHIDNYRRAGAAIGVDLVADPALALGADAAAAVLVRGSMEGWFTSHKLGDFIAGDRCDYRAARAVINGDVAGNGPRIATLATAYEAALAASEGVTERPTIEQATGLKRGDAGPGVETLQRNLTAIGISPGGIDGVFGRKTEEAVSAFQDRYVPPQRGVVDPITAAALVEAVAARS